MRLTLAHTETSCILFTITYKFQWKSCWIILKWDCTFARVQYIIQIILFSHDWTYCFVWLYISYHTVWDMECIYFRYKSRTGKIVMFWNIIRSSAFNVWCKYAWNIPRIFAELCVTPTGLLNARRPVRMTFARSLAQYFTTCAVVSLVLKKCFVTSKNNQH